MDRFLIRRRILPGAMLCLSLAACQAAEESSVLSAETRLPELIVDTVPLTDDQFEAVLSQSPVNDLMWNQETSLFGAGVVGFAEVFVAKDNELASHGIGIPAVLTTPTRTLEGYYLLGSGFELTHTIRIVILVDNRQATVRTSTGAFPYVTVSELAPGTRIGLSLAVPISPGWHTLHFVLLADTNKWYEDSATRIAQRFSFAATRYEIFNGVDPLPLLLDASQMPQWVESTHRELGGIQVLDARTGDMLNEWASIDDGLQELRLQVFHQAMGSDGPLSVPVRYVVFVNDHEIDSVEGTLDRTVDDSLMITLDANLGTLAPDDQLMVMAIPYPDTALTEANGNTIQYGVPVFSQRLRVR